jgi:hypothetical protein
MKKLLMICSLAVFFAGCVVVSEKTGPSKEPHPADASAAGKPAGPVGPPPMKEPVKGSLLINISVGNEDSFHPYEWAEIYLDDTFISSTSHMQLNLEPGQHKISVQARGYKSYEKIISILAGRTGQSLNILLEKE